jgi:hypothetical protein
VGIGVVVILNRPDPAAARSTGESEDETYKRMTADPNKEAEDAAVAVVNRLGGTFERQQGHPVYQPVIDLKLRDRPVTDEDLQSMAGLINLRNLDLSGTRVTDAGLPTLLAFRFVVSVDLSRTAVTGKGLSQLTPLTLLTRLRLAGSKVDDAGLAGLVGVPKVSELDLSDTEISASGIDRLKVLSRLGTLNIARTKITGKAAPQLAAVGVGELDLSGIALSNEELLTLVNAKPRVDPGRPPPGGPIRMAPAPTKLTLRGANPSITDETLQALAKRNDVNLLVTTADPAADPALAIPEDVEDGQPDKSVLDLSGSKVTDAGLKHVSALPTVRGLYLKETAVTDAGLKHLSAFANMRVLDLRNTKVTDAGVAELKTKLPKCTVVR